MVDFIIILIALLLGGSGIAAALWKSRDAKEAKEIEKEAYDKLQAQNIAQQKVNEEKKKNEEKIKDAHSGNKLDNANAVIDLLRK